MVFRQDRFWAHASLTVRLLVFVSSCFRETSKQRRCTASDSRPSADGWLLALPTDLGALACHFLFVPEACQVAGVSTRFQRFVQRSLLTRTSPVFVPLWRHHWSLSRDVNAARNKTFAWVRTALEKCPRASALLRDKWKSEWWRYAAKKTLGLPVENPDPWLCDMKAAIACGDMPFANRLVAMASPDGHELSPFSHLRRVWTKGNFNPRKPVELSDIARCFPRLESLTYGHVGTLAWNGRIAAPKTLVDVDFWHKQLGVDTDFLRHLVPWLPATLKRFSGPLIDTAHVSLTAFATRFQALEDLHLKFGEYRRSTDAEISAHAYQLGVLLVALGDRLSELKIDKWREDRPACFLDPSLACHGRGVMSKLRVLSLHHGQHETRFDVVTPYLRELKLTGNYRGWPQEDDPRPAGIAGHVFNLKHLITLNLTKMRIDTAAATSFAELPALADLTVEYCLLEKEALPSLLGNLSPNLKALTLTMCDIGEPDGLFPTLAAGFRRHSARFAALQYLVAMFSETDGTVDRYLQQLGTHKQVVDAMQMARRVYPEVHRARGEGATLIPEARDILLRAAGVLCGRPADAESSDFRAAVRHHCSTTLADFVFDHGLRNKAPGHGWHRISELFDLVDNTRKALLKKAWDFLSVARKTLPASVDFGDLHAALTECCPKMIHCGINCIVRDRDQFYRGRDFDRVAE